jgi:HEAT repeat protein
VAPLLAAAGNAKAGLRVAALRFASSLEGADRPIVLAALRGALDCASNEVIACAVEALGPLGDGDDLARIAALVQHADEHVAAVAANAVSDLAARHVEAARSVLRAKRPGDDPLALGCILLGAIASAQQLSGEEVRLLERALSHDHPRVRCAAVNALAQAGGETAASAVVFALADEEHEVQLAAIRALGRLGCADALVGLVSDTRDAALTATTLRALSDADPARALAAARELVAYPDPAVACAAVEAIANLVQSPRLSEIGPGFAAECEEALSSTLEHPQTEVVKLAIVSMSVHSSPGAFARLGACLDHASWEVRRLAAELLGQEKSPRAKALLGARYEREKEPIVREAIAVAASLRPPSPGDSIRPRPCNPARPDAKDVKEGA